MEDGKIIKARAINKILRFLSFRARSEQEVRDFLSKKKFSENVIHQTIDYAKELKLLDDVEFTKWWVEQRSEFRQKGNIVLKNELLQKGINREIIEKVLSENSNEEKAAQKLFEKSKKKFGDLTNRENFQKAVLYFQRRGFSWDIIKKVLDKNI